MWAITIKHAITVEKCQIYIVVVFNSALANTVLLQMLVLKPSFNGQSVWIERIMVHTLIMIMVELTIIWYLRVHKSCTCIDSIVSLQHK